MKIKSLSAWQLGRKANGVLQRAIGGLFLSVVFSTLLSAAASGVEFMGAIKIDFYVQDSVQVPVPDPEGRFAADIFLEASSGGSVSSATLSRPGGSVIHLEREEPGSPYWNGGEEFSQRSERDTAFPDGVYTFKVGTAGHGNQQVALNLVGNVFPAAPRVSNYSQAQEIDTEKPFRLSWDSFAGAKAEDFIVLGVEDESADDEIFHSGFLPASTTSIEFPSGLFQQGRAYGVYIMFGNVTDWDEVTFSGGRALVGYFSETWLEIRTQGAEIGVNGYGVVKLNRFLQSSASGPLPMEEDDAFMGEVFLEVSGADTVLAASIALPNGTVFPLEQDDLEDNWRLEIESVGQAERDVAFPDGTYELRIETVDGERTASLELVGDAFPAAPRISMYAELQAIDSGGTFSIAWDTFLGGGADDFIVIGIEDPVDDFETVFESDFLPATARSLEIPAGVLKPGRVYEAWISFVRVVDKNEGAFVGATGLAGYISETMFPIRTQANPGPGNGIDSFGIMKTALYRQTSAAAPELETEGDPYEIFAFAEATSANSLAGVAVIAPDGAVHYLEEEDYGSGFLMGKDSFASQAVLDGEFPNGIYTVNIAGPSQGKYVSLNLAGNAYPSPVRISNFEAAQSIDPGQAFVLSWDLPGGIGVEDRIVVGIEDSLTKELVFESGFLPGNMASVELSAGLFQPEHAYSVSVSLVRVVDTDTAVFPNANGIETGYVASTLLEIQTGDGSGLTFMDWTKQLPLGERGEMDDPGGHGIVNLLRYAFGMEAGSPDRGKLPQLGTGSWGGNPEADHLTILFIRRKNADDIGYRVEASSDLVAWEELPFFAEVVDDGNGETETVTITDPEPISTHSTRFLRVRIVR